MRLVYLYSVLLLMLLSLSCKQASSRYGEMPTFTEKGGINVIIEIPAGTNPKTEYNYANKRFEVEEVEGKKRSIDFLPYPGNYGFIPSTYMDPEKGGDGDALDVLVLSEALERGTIIEVKPLATLELLDNGEIDTKIIAIPVDTSLQIIDATDYITFMVKYNAAQQIIQNWFLSYKGLGKMEFVAWKDDRAAMAEIKRWATEVEREVED